MLRERHSRQQRVHVLSCYFLLNYAKAICGERELCKLTLTTCYFLLNYAGPYRRTTCLLTPVIACYFLLNYALKQFNEKYAKKNHLLFSFELCVLGTMQALAQQLSHLLFSFELCLSGFQGKTRISTSRYLAACYFLLNYAHQEQ